MSTDFYKQQAEPVSKPVGVAYPACSGSSLQVHLGFVVAILVAVGVSWLLNRTTIGFGFRAVGANIDAARAAGIDPNRATVLAMSLSAVCPAWPARTSSRASPCSPGSRRGSASMGSRSRFWAEGNPGGVVAAAFLFEALRTGGRSMRVLTQTPIDIIVVIQALVIAFVAAPALVRGLPTEDPALRRGRRHVREGMGLASTVAQPAVLRGTSVRRARVMGILFILVGVLMSWRSASGRRAVRRRGSDEPGA